MLILISGLSFVIQTRHDNSTHCIGDNAEHGLALHYQKHPSIRRTQLKCSTCLASAVVRLQWRWQIHSWEREKCIFHRKTSLKYFQNQQFSLTSPEWQALQYLQVVANFNFMNKFHSHNTKEECSRTSETFRCEHLVTLNTQNANLIVSSGPFLRAKLHIAKR